VGPGAVDSFRSLLFRSYTFFWGVLAGVWGRVILLVEKLVLEFLVEIAFYHIWIYSWSVGWNE
jgi:hypothetical protein